MTADINGLYYSLTGVQSTNMKDFWDMSKWIESMTFMLAYCLHTISNAITSK